MPRSVLTATCRPSGAKTAMTVAGVGSPIPPFLSQRHIPTRSGGVGRRGQQGSPSGLDRAITNWVSCPSCAFPLPEAVSHSLTVPSLPPVASNLLSGL